MDSSNAINALGKLVSTAPRAKSPTSGAEICRLNARECREQAACFSDLDQCLALVTLAEKWDALAAEMDRDGVAASDLRHSH